jgi:hypothetical protein
MQRHYTSVAALVAPTDVVDVTGAAALEGEEKALAVVVDVHPVANIEPVPVQRHVL